MYELKMEIPEAFGLPKVFKLTVPIGYNHERQIGDFCREVKGRPSTYSYDDNLSHFDKATHHLKPGKTYRVAIFPVQRRVSCQETIEFLHQCGAVLVGAQGLTLAQSLRPDQFFWGSERESIVVSLDEEDALWNDGLSFWIPQIILFPDGEWSFGLTELKQPLCWLNYVIAFFH
jgi:hypothetical protein